MKGIAVHEETAEDKADAEVTAMAEVGVGNND